MPDTDTRSPLQRLRNPRSAALAAIVLLAVGGGAGAVAMQATRPSVTMAPATPVAIRSLASSGIVTVKGRVAEIYGNKFILADASGRALVDTGREGEGGGLVTTGEPVTVQGRFDRGFVHAAFLVGPDNKVTALGPLGGPHDGPRHGPRHGPDDGPDAPPPGADRVGPASPAAPVAPSGTPASAAAPAGPADTGH
ncbi:hypothetical protein [uncultured Sphingomonas sp.]|uniref:hypothetical protein n=1 Tax=uncultured Sphingomonas sp. TaxID=158754 RepID=UPI0035CAFC72